MKRSIMAAAVIAMAQAGVAFAGDGGQKVREVLTGYKEAASRERPGPTSRPPRRAIP